MHLIWRVISPYDDSSLCLGVFREREQAEQAREHYIAHVTCGEIADRWATQTYRAVDLSQDVQILSDLPLREMSADTVEIFVVSEVEEAFGQIRRRFVAVCGTRGSAQQVEHELDAQVGDFPRGTDIECLALDRLAVQPVGVHDRWRVWTG